MSETISAGFQLSQQQKHVWTLGTDESAFHSTVAVLLEGKLKPESLKSSLHAVSARYEILRTTFERRPGMKVPFQVVHETLAPRWQESDISSLSQEKQQAMVDEAFESEKTARFDLDRGPILRATLLTLAENKHVLVLSLPPLCADIASLHNLVRNIADIYAGNNADGEVFQYADFSAWQNGVLQEDDQDARFGKRFWQDLLADCTTTVRLPLETKPAEGAAFKPRALDIEVPPPSPVGDPESFFAACWHILQWRLTGQNAIVMAYTNEASNHEEIASSIGLFAKSLPIPHEFDGSRTFESVRQDLQSTRSRAFQQQDYLSLDETTQDLPVSFVAETLPPRISAGDVWFSIVRQDSETERFRMQLRCVIEGESYRLRLRYDPQYFPRAAADMVAKSLAVLIRNAALNPSASIEELGIMDPADLRKIVVEFNSTSADYPREQCIHQLFEKQAARTPERPALRFGETVLTYAQLNARANQLAHLLRSHGVKSDVIVGLCPERSAEMIIGLLGILKAGGAYLPLIPDNPKARLAHQLSETKSPVLVTEKKLASSLPEFSGKTIYFDDDRAALDKQSVENPELINAPEDTAYVIYTSGSTGIPKGVAVSHSNLVNYAHFASAKLNAGGDARNFATVSTLGADLGNTAIFPSLISGGCLHVISYETAMAANLFSEYAHRHAIDVLKITPSHLETLLTSPQGIGMLPRKYLVLGGEAASWELVRRVQDAGSGAVINHYGPTEATVGCCTFSVAENDTSAWAPATVPIGRPIANSQVYILDSLMRPVPIGVPGELCIGGAGIAKGYLNQPRQTLERFVKDTFSSDAGARLYRTGDLARFLPDGNVEFLGRIDQQIKIRGFRVEPAEIETVLKTHPAVRQALVIPRPAEAGDKTLVAYFVVKGQQVPASDELRSFLQNQLPDYMVPSKIIHLEALPLTRNGKVDFAALPTQEKAVSEKVAPRNPAEQQLLEIWREVLRIDNFGVQDNFFDLGGHSLLATQVISRVCSAFRIQLPLRSLFDSPTVAGLADEIARMPQTSEDLALNKLLQELEGLSDEEAERLLASETEGGDGSKSGNR